MTDATTPSAYDLLTKPTLDLTEEEVKIIIEDLRRRRNAYVTKGVKDQPAKKPAAEPKDKKLSTAQIAASLNLDFDL